MPPENDDDQPNLPLIPGRESASVPEVEDDDSPEEGSESETPEDETEDEAGPDESGEQAEESDDESEESDEEEPEAEQAEEEPESDDPLAALRAQVESERAVTLQLVDLLKSQQQQAAPKPKLADTFEDVPDDLLVMACFGGATEERLKPFSAEQINRANMAAKTHAAKVIKLIRNPKALLEDLREDMDKIVADRVRPLHEDYHARKGQEIADRFLKPLDKETADRARAIFKTLPGFNASTWGEVERDMGVATKLARAEVLDKADKASKQKRIAGKVQKQAAGGGKLKGTKPSGAAGVPAGRPVKTDSESWSDYSERVRAYETGRINNKK